MHEASLHKENCFITLTYDDEHIPVRNNLHYPTVQKFLKRLRFHEKGKKIRYFACGEYGDMSGRAHYHAILFGHDFPDKTPLRLLDWSKTYSSEQLTRVWGLGFTSVGLLTFESAAYVARYAMKKIGGPAAAEHYTARDEHGEYKITKEFAHMSLKPAVGRGFYEKWKEDIYPHDYVVINGKEYKPPKYYDKLYKKENEDEYEYLKMKREEKIKPEDNTEKRIQDKKTVTEARIKQKKRTI